jgi:hypothetical protein
MNCRMAFAVAVCFSLAGNAAAHRLDEYLQATIFSVEKDRVQASMRLIPGVAVSSVVLADIDTNADGVISEAEQRAYAVKVLRDVSLKIDGQPLRPQLLSVEFPKIADVKEGLGEIHIDFSAHLANSGPNRRLIFENHHYSRISAYLVNCLVPGSRDIQIVAQNRNEVQSFYQLDYVQASSSTDGPLRTMGAPFGFWFHGFAGMFRLGMRHIAEGNDHLLFLLALLLPAPLLVSRGRWAGFAGVRHSVLQILRVVTAFTLGHSITLALAALGVVSVPSRPIEVLIAVSILVSAVHALRPLFPGREAAIAAFFGLIHGLAFATTLGQLGLTRWERVMSILGFNVGIETMQLIVVAATMPSLVLLARTPAYLVFRTGGGLFAAVASLGWIAERLLHLHNAVDDVMDGVAHHAIWIATILFLISLVCWLIRDSLETNHWRRAALTTSGFRSITVK